MWQLDKMAREFSYSYLHSRVAFIVKRRQSFCLWHSLAFARKHQTANMLFNSCCVNFYEEDFLPALVLPGFPATSAKQIRLHLKGNMLALLGGSRKVLWAPAHRLSSNAFIIFIICSGSSPSAAVGAPLLKFKSSFSIYSAVWNFGFSRFFVVSFQ